MPKYNVHDFRTGMEITQTQDMDAPEVKSVYLILGEMFTVQAVDEEAQMFWVEPILQMFDA